MSGVQRRPPSILVVDDEQRLGEALQLTLHDVAQVVVESAAPDALARLERGERYDLILCDLMMPDMDGIEFHRQLQRKWPEEAARVVFITGCAITARVDAFIGRTRNLLLEKPLDLEGLKALIERRTRPLDATG
jgi:CheY-like chemotaxis protein